MKKKEPTADEMRKEFYEGMKRLEMGIAELKESQKKTDEQILKLKEIQEKTDKQILELKESQRKTDEQMKKTDRRIDKSFKAIQSVSDGYGRFVEGIVSPSAERYFSQIGYKVGDVLHRAKIKKDDIVIAEYDTIMEGYMNGKKYLLIGEAKTYCSLKDVKEFLKQIKKIHEKDEYKDVEVIGFVAVVNCARGVEERVIEEGLYFFKVTDDVMEAKVPADFKPRIF